jgi:hypothetical protein
MANLSAAYSPAATANQVFRVFQIVENRLRLAGAERRDNISATSCRNRTPIRSPQRNSLRQANLKRLANP